MPGHLMYAQDLEQILRCIYFNVMVMGTAMKPSMSCPRRATKLALALAVPLEENTIHMVCPFALVHLGAKLIPRPVP